MNLMKCSPENHSTYHIIQRFNIDLRGFDLIHAGAHDLIERELYERCRVNRVYAFEANPIVIIGLEQRLLGTDWKAFQACLWSENGIEKEFYYYQDNYNGAGGLFLPERMNEFVDCKPTGKSFKIKTTTLNQYIEDNIVDISNIKLFNADLQGAELDACIGATKLLESSMLEWLIIETSTFDCYKNGTKDKDLVDLLKQYNFTKIGFWKDWGNDKEQHGDAIYRRIS